MRKQKQHLFYQADGADAGNTADTEEVEQGLEPQIFDDELSLDEMESGLEAMSNVVAEEKDAPEAKEDAPEVDKNADAPETQKDADAPGEDAPEVKENKDETTQFTITDEYLAEHPDDADILTKLKGEYFSPKALKNYIHSQRHIEKLESDRREVQLPNEQPPQATKPLSSFTDDEVAEYRATEITKRIQQKYPEFPDDGITNRDSLNSYYADMVYDKPADLEDFKADFAKIKESISSEIKQEVEIGRNWQSYAEQTIEESFSEFSDFIKAKGVTPEDLGIKMDVELAKSIIYNKNGLANPLVVFERKGIPIVMKDRFTAMLKEKFIDNIIALKEKIAGEKAYTKRTEAEPPPSISNANLGNEAPKKLGKVVTDDMSLEEAEEIMKNL